MKKGNIPTAENVENKENQEEDSRTSNEDVDDQDSDGGRWLRTRNQVDYREASQSDSSDSEMSDKSLEGFDDEADVEMLREEKEFVGDNVADAVMNGINEERLLDNSYSIFVGKNCDQENYDCDEFKSMFADKKNLDSHHCGCHEENESNLISAVRL